MCIVTYSHFACGHRHVVREDCVLTRSRDPYRPCTHGHGLQIQDMTKDDRNQDRPQKVSRSELLNCNYCRSILWKHAKAPVPDTWSIKHYGSGDAELRTASRELIEGVMEEEGEEESDGGVEVSDRELEHAMQGLGIIYGIGERGGEQGEEEEKWKQQATSYEKVQDWLEKSGKDVVVASSSKPETKPKTKPESKPETRPEVDIDYGGPFQTHGGACSPGTADRIKLGLQD